MWAIPFIGPIINGITGYFNKKQDVDLEKYKVNGEINVEAMKQDTAIIQARAELLAQAMQHRGIRIAQYLFIYPIGVWFALVMYDSAFRNLIPGWTWVVLAPPPKFEYYIMAVFAYLFATAWKGK